MRDEYAVFDGTSILSRTEGFQQDMVTDMLPLSDGNTLLICSQDTEMLRQRLEEAEKAIAAKDTFLSNMSHDMRTPMNAIVGLTLLAKMHIDETARVSDALNKIETASSHLLSLINDVLDMSRISSGRMQISAECFSLNSLIHDILIIVRPQAEKKQHQMRFLTDSISVEALRGDTLRLRQIFVNVISNAVKYTPDGGEITVRFSEEVQGDTCFLCFTCQDNGIGMSEEFLQHIFEPFERVRSSTVSRIEGTGLGMSIVHRLVHAMDGEIQIQSALQKGTAVMIRLPLSWNQEEQKAAGLEQRRFLVVEADEALRHSYISFLSSFGAACVLTASAQEAMDAMADAGISRQSFDLVILGRDCGQGDKLDLAAYLHKASPQLPILLISDENWEAISYRAEQSGIVSFIPLPLLRMSLFNGLKAALDTLPGTDPSDAYPDLKGKRLLLVEDNLINREIALEILGVTGAEIDVAENGRQAVDRFLASPVGGYAMILMDIQMPVMDGYQATAEIRTSKRPDAGRIPIYAMTANTFAEDIAKAREAGMDGHIAKPIDVTVLMQALRGAVGR